MTDTEEVPVLSGAGDGRWGASDLLGVITVFDRMLIAMEARLVAKMDDSSRLAAERWRKHDEERINHNRVAAERFERVESQILKVENVIEEHLDKERAEDLIMEARVKPITQSLAWLWGHWKEIVLLFLSLAAFATWISDRILEAI